MLGRKISQEGGRANHHRWTHLSGQFEENGPANRKFQDLVFVSCFSKVLLYPKKDIMEFMYFVTNIGNSHFWYGVSIPMPEG